MKKILNLIFLLICLAYCCLFIDSLQGRWFNLSWTSDDAVQQSYPFHEVFEPGLFANDIITEVMKGYLPPIHYWLTYILTYLTGSPIMAGHWVMLIQLSATLAFIFASVFAVSKAWQPALFALVWFIHTRTAVQRLTGGFPRGWSAVVLAGFLYFAITKNHTAILLLIGFGCIMHPPSTFLIASAYGFWLLYLLAKSETRKRGQTCLIKLFLASPVYLLTLWLIIRKPEEIGQMVTYAEAIKMPGFTNPGGRFPFLPLPSINWEFHHFAYNAFINRLYQAPEVFGDYAWLIIVSALLVFLVKTFAQGSSTNKDFLPKQLWFYLLAVIFVYLASRQLLFYLYVPNRHLLLPLAVFLTITFSSGMWQIANNNLYKAYLNLSLLAVFICLGSGTGLYGDANFNYHIYRKGRAFEWLSFNSPKTAIIAGHPTHVDPVPLFAKRRVYVSTEVAHPFYPRYYTEMERRIELSLRAHYSKTLVEFISILSNEKIDYFVFSRQRFYADRLTNETFYLPFRDMVKELTSRHHEDYAYKRLPKKVDKLTYPFLVYRDDQSAVVDLNLLREFFRKSPEDTIFR